MQKDDSYYQKFKNHTKDILKTKCNLLLFSISILKEV